MQSSLRQQQQQKQHNQQQQQQLVVDEHSKRIMEAVQNKLAGNAIFVQP
jgi:hypothetical protein